MMQNCVGLFLQKRARLQPDKTGHIFEGHKTSYREWSQRTNRAARAFIGLGVLPGDRIGLLLENSPEFLECFFALAHLGAIVVPLNWRLTPPEISYIVRDSGICALVYGSEFHHTIKSFETHLPNNKLIAIGGASSPSGYNYEELLQAQSETAPQTGGTAQDPAMIIYTSGTTGRPKGAVLTHNNLFYGALNISLSLDWRTDDRVLVAMPLFHIGALIITLINVYFGATTVLMKAFDPGRFLRNVAIFQINSFVAVETMLLQMAKVNFFQEAELSSLRWVLSGPVPASLQEAWSTRGVVIQQVYGLTETTGGAAVLAAKRVSDKFGSTGLPMFHTDIRVVDQDGGDCKAGRVGEILIHGPHVMQAYWNNPTATSETIKNGWLSTGDLGKLDKEGFLFIVGRLKDMIRSGSENIYPTEIEIVLTEIPQIKEVAIVGIPDPTWGEVVCAVVRLHEGKMLTLNDIVSHCNNRLGKYKIPQRLFVTTEPLPRGPTGRVQKQGLLNKLLGHDEI
jgi:acyl-CoA synthetase (AMP-forming)/AMP-acid ligase II